MSALAPGAPWRPHEIARIWTPDAQHALVLTAVRWLREDGIVEEIGEDRR